MYQTVSTKLTKYKITTVANNPKHTLRMQQNESEMRKMQQKQLDRNGSQNLASNMLRIIMMIAVRISRQ